MSEIICIHTYATSTSTYHHVSGLSEMRSPVQGSSAREIASYHVFTIEHTPSSHGFQGGYNRMRCSLRRSTQRYPISLIRLSRDDLQATLPKVVGLRSDTQRSSCSSRQDFICDNNRSDHLLIVFPGKSVLLRSLAVDGHCFF